MTGNDYLIYEPLSIREVQLKNFYDVSPWYKKPFMKLKLCYIHLKVNIKRWVKNW